MKQLGDIIIITADEEEYFDRLNDEMNMKISDAKTRQREHSCLSSDKAEYAIENEIKKSYFSKFPDFHLYLTKDVKVKRPSLEDYSWDEIKEITDKNLHTELFNIGDSKKCFIQDEECNLIIAAFNTTNDIGIFNKIVFITNKPISYPEYFDIQHDVADLRGYLVYHGIIEELPVK